MSGHYKWATTKHKKAAIDAKRGKMFAKLTKNIEVAARTGGPDPAGNPTLYDAIQKAKKSSVPNDNIDRAVKRGGGLDVTVRRNAFGRQVESFEGDVDFTIFDDPVHAVFIRAPWVEEVGPDVEVLASVDVPGVGDRIVAVQQGPVMATSFHPEVSDDLRIHQYFLDLVTKA